MKQNHEEDLNPKDWMHMAWAIGLIGIAFILLQTWILPWVLGIPAQGSSDGFIALLVALMGICLSMSAISLVKKHQREYHAQPEKVSP